MYNITRLKNGLVVVTAAMPEMASVCVGLWVAVGGRHEPARLSGAAHFIEHAVFKGTSHRSARDISEAIEGIGGSLNAFTSEENTCFYAKASGRHVHRLVEVLFDLVLEPAFCSKDIAKEREVIKEELAMYMDQPHHLVLELLNEVLWPGHPLGRCIIGCGATLDYLNRRRLLAYKRQHYVCQNTVVVGAGCLDHADFVRTVRKHARAMPRGKAACFRPVNQAQTRIQLGYRRKKTEQTQIAIGIKTCSRHQPERYPLRALNTLLGENMSSRLFQVLREDHGLAYSVFSSLGFFDDVGTLTITAGLDPDKIPLALRLIGREMQRLCQRVPTAAEIHRAKEYLIGQLDLQLESTENQMIWLGEQWLGFGRIVPPDRTKDGLRRVKPSDVRGVARAFFHPCGINLALVSTRKPRQGLLREIQLG